MISRRGREGTTWCNTTKRRRTPVRPVTTGTLARRGPRAFREVTLGRPSTAGLVVGAVFWLASLGPTLLPRAWMFQAAISALSFLVGYGLDLGTIGNTLDWQVHGEATSSNPRPPDAPDASLYGFTGAPPASAKIVAPGTSRSTPFNTLARP